MGEMHKFIERNKSGQDYVVGDIHGCYKLLLKELKNVGFDRSIDRLFSVGDIIDRGPDSLKCLKLLQEPWFYIVRGNHEQMLINACGGEGQSYNWWASYGSWAKRIKPEEMAAWAQRLQNLPIAVTVDMGDFEVGICHAEPDGQYWKKMIENRASEDVMLWGRRVLRNKPEQNVVGISVTIHGHTPLEQPTWVGNRYFMDTGAWYSGKILVRKIKDIFDEYHLMQSL